MKTLISALLLFVGTSSYAAEDYFGNTLFEDNTDWQYGDEVLTWPDSKNSSDLPDGYRLYLTSDMRDADVSLEYAITMYADNTGAPSSVSGWSLLIKFNGDLVPTDIESMSVGYMLGEDWVSLKHWTTVDNAVVVLMSVDNIVALRDAIGRLDPASIEVWYRPKSSDINESKLIFDLKNGWSEKFQGIETNLATLDADDWLHGTAYFVDQPINTLPPSLKPPPSDMVKAAEGAGVDIDTAYTLSINELQKLITDRLAEQARIREKARKAREAKAWEEEQARRAAEKAKKEAEAKAQSAKMDAHAKTLRNFDWPYIDCDRPSFPSINAGQSSRDRFNRNYKSWYRCLDNAWEKDQRAIRDLVLAIDGKWDSDGDSVSYSVYAQFMPRIKELFGDRDRRAKNRNNQIDTMANAIDDFNSRDADRQQSEEFWGDINESLDNMNRDMDRMYQQRQQQWNQQIYITPGYN